MTTAVQHLATLLQTQPTSEAGSSFNSLITTGDLQPASFISLTSELDTSTHTLPSYLAATQVTLEIQTRHASDVFKVDSVADVTLLHVQFSYQDILNVLSTNLTPLSHLIIKIKILFGMVHLYRFLKCERAIATMLHGFHV